MGGSVIWQPKGVYSKSDFNVEIDRGFVEKASQLEINEDIRFNMKDLANRLTNGKMSQPYLFEGNTYMVSQFTSEAGNGVWLCFDSRGKKALETFEGNVEFYSHNVDRAYQQIDLMSLVDIWVNYYSAVKGALEGS